jgi:hypothetical protein
LIFRTACWPKRDTSYYRDKRCAQQFRHS